MIKEEKLRIMLSGIFLLCKKTDFRIPLETKRGRAQARNRDLGVINVEVVYTIKLDNNKQNGIT